MQTRDQRYAKDVFDHVMAIKDAKFARSYGSMAHKLPILIHTSGLIQALTFADTRKTQGPPRLLIDLSQTVLGASSGKDDLLKQARGETDNRANSLQAYIYLTEQVLAALLWYKRYAQSILNVELDDDGEDQSDGEDK